LLTNASDKDNLESNLLTNASDKDNLESDLPANASDKDNLESNLLTNASDKDNLESDLLTNASDKDNLQSNLPTMRATRKIRLPCPSMAEGVDSQVECAERRRKERKGGVQESDDGLPDKDNLYCAFPGLQQVEALFISPAVPFSLSYYSLIRAIHVFPNLFLQSFVPSPTCQRGS
jgi:hypothetical protein